MRQPKDIRNSDPNRMRAMREMQNLTTLELHHHANDNYVSQNVPVDIFRARWDRRTDNGR